MSDLLLIPVCLLAGFLLKYFGIAGKGSNESLNNIIIYITLPALTLLYIPQIDIQSEHILPGILVWVVVLIAIVVFNLLEKIFKWDKKTTGTLILTGGLANTSFVGFPVLMALFGEEGLKIGVIIDQAGSFLVLSTLGIIVASVYSSGKVSPANIFKDILKYPSFFAFVLSVILLIFQIDYSPEISGLLKKIGSPTMFLALISVGMQIEISISRETYRELTLGLLYKLLLAPAIIYLLFLLTYKTEGIVFQASIIEASMPPMVMGSILAIKYNLNKKLASMMVGIGILLSALSISLWYLLIK